MFLVGIMSWWYGKGFSNRLNMLKQRLLILADHFSVGLLLRTLFNPFRQISADVSGNSLAEKIQAFFDKLLSRVIGAIVRSFMIIFGITLMYLQVIFGAMILLLWLLLPVLPIVGLILTILGWTIYA